MALRAGYYGVKRSIRNKLSILAASTPADISPENPIASKNDVLTSVDLLKDTTGWTGKNRCPITITNQTQVEVELVVNADKSVTLNGTPTGNYSFPLGTVTNFNIGDKFVISGCPEGGGEDTYNIFVVCRDSNNTSLLAISQYGADVTFTVPANTVKIDVYARVVNRSPISNKTFYTMIDTPEQHSLSPAYEPYHESVAEMFAKVINLAFTITTDNYTGDIDELDAGIRYCTNAAAHNPGNAWGYCITIKNPSNKIQLFIGQASTGIWYRRFASSAWQTWNNVTLTEVTATREEETKKATKKKVIKEEEE